MTRSDYRVVMNEGQTNVEILENVKASLADRGLHSTPELEAEIVRLDPGFELWVDVDEHGDATPTQRTRSAKP